LLSKNLIVGFDFRNQKSLILVLKSLVLQSKICLIENPSEGSNHGRIEMNWALALYFFWDR